MEWMLGLMLVAAIAGIFLLRRLRRRTTEAFPLTEVHIPPGTRKQPIIEVDLLLDIPPVTVDEPVRLGYVDSTVPAVQEPGPLRSARKM